MPTYDYECRNCGHVVEVIHGVNATGPTSCVRCGGPMRKLISQPSIHFKGSGWAKKDRSSRPSAKSDDKDKGEKAPAADAEASTKADSKADGAAATPKSETKSADTGAKSSGGSGSTD